MITGLINVSSVRDVVPMPTWRPYGGVSLSAQYKACGHELEHDIALGGSVWFGHSHQIDEQ